MPLKQERDKKKKPENNDALRAFAQFSQIGITMASSIIVGVLLGKYLDDAFGTQPWLLLVFSLLGAGAAIKALFNISGGKK